jgi:adenylyltransferase/sulfurtransferase
LSEQQVERYSRQIILPQVGGRGQQMLLAASVTLYGETEMAESAGRYLAGAGVGRLRLSPSVAAAIDGYNPDCIATMLTAKPAADLSGGSAVVICADVEEAIGVPVYAASRVAGVPFIVGQAGAMVGWMCVCGSRDVVCYACLTRPSEAGNSDAGLGTLTAGLLGSLVAIEALKTVLGLPASSSGRRVLVDALHGEVRVETVKPEPQCPACSPAL